MDYSYKIRQFRPQDHFLQIEYSAVGKATLIKNFRMPPNLTAENLATELAAFAEASAPIGEWEYQDTVNALDPALVDTETVVAATYTPPVNPTPSLAEQKAEASYQAMVDSARKQEEGVLYQPGNGKTYRLPCGQIEIERMRLYKREALAGDRTSGKWRAYEVTAEGEAVLYQTLNLTQLQTAANLMIAHVEKCEQAESNAIDKIRSGDLGADFQSEFALL